MRREHCLDIYYIDDSLCKIYTRAYACVCESGRRRDIDRTQYRATRPCSDVWRPSCISLAPI